MLRNNLEGLSLIYAHSKPIIVGKARNLTILRVKSPLSNFCLGGSNWQWQNLIAPLATILVTTVKSLRIPNYFAGVPMTKQKVSITMTPWVTEVADRPRCGTPEMRPRLRFCWQRHSDRKGRSWRPSRRSFLAAAAVGSVSGAFLLLRSWLSF